MKTKFLIFGTLILLFTISCSKNDSSDNSPITTNDANINAKIDAVSDDVSNIAEDQFDATMADNLSGKTSETTDVNPYLPSCVTITRVPAFGTTIEPGTLVTKTLDFGTTGCAMLNGNILKGKIIISFTYNPNATTNSISYTLDNFYDNAIKLEGTKTFTRTIASSVANSDAHPIVTMDMDMKITFPNGNEYHRTGQRIREIIAGLSTRTWTDNVYQVTGNWTTVFPNNSLFKSTIASPLLIKLSCIGTSVLTVQGVITHAKNNHTATLDFGNGGCDNLAVLTIDGVAKTITLGN